MEFLPIVMGPIILLRISYLTAALLTFAVYAVPALRVRFLDYGARSFKVKSGKATSSQPPEQPSSSILSSRCRDLLDLAASIRVPHSWFASFYTVSSVLSLYHASEILRKGPVFAAIADSVPADTPSMTFTQIQLAWILMFVQGSRRLFESMTLTPPSNAKMWVGHWAVGLYFYIATGLAVWIEGVPTLNKHIFSVSDLALSGPSLRTFIAVPIFIFASGLQHDVHVYLASLKAASSRTAGSGTQATPRPPSAVSGPSSHYVLPRHPAFGISLTPHYFAECLIYLALAILTAPAGVPVNGTLACALVFVTVNLGVTAEGTREWYWEKFGAESVQGRARMIPWIW